MNWKADRRGIQPGGDVGGDHQATESFSVRYHLVDGTGPPYSVATVYFYGVDRRERMEVDDSQRYEVEQQIEMTICDDWSRPGDSERWSDARYRFPSGEVFATPAEAEQHARDVARGHYTGDIRWDGQPIN